MSPFAVLYLHHVYIQVVRSAICWAVTDLVGRWQKVTPLYGSPSRYPILAVRGLMGAAAMTLYYEALQRLPLGDMVTTLLTLILARMWAAHAKHNPSLYNTVRALHVGFGLLLLKKALTPVIPSARCSRKIQMLCYILLCPIMLASSCPTMQPHLACTHLLGFASQMTLYFIYPCITVLMALLVHGEAITWLAGVGCAISLTGVAFIAQPPFLFGSASEQYNMQHWLGGLHSQSPCSYQ